MAILSLNDILRNEVLESLQGSDGILVKAVTDLTSQAKPGSDRVTIPNVTGLALSSITAGSRATSGGMTTTGRELVMDQVKQVPEYISWKNGKESAVDQKAAFLNTAPRVFAQGLELAIATKLATASANDFDSASATAGVFAVSDLGKAKKLMDEARVPKSDRYIVMNAEAMEILAATSEFQDGSKSLSAEALKEGIVSRVKGFNVIQSEDVGGTGAANKLHCFHKSAVAFALHGNMEFIDKDIEEYGESFLSLRGKYGAIDCDNAAGASERKLTISVTTATS
jgi:hypothetical protein